MKVKLQNVRLSFPHLFKPKAMDSDSAAKYQASFLFEPDSPNHAAMEEAIEAVKKEKWPKKEPRLKGICLRDGDEAGYDGYADMLFVSSSSTSKPKVKDRDKSDLDESSGIPYAGCYVNAVVEVWAQDNQYGKRVNAELKGVQFVKNGDRFGGGAPMDDDEFDDLGFDDDDDI